MVTFSCLLTCTGFESVAVVSLRRIRDEHCRRIRERRNDDALQVNDENEVEDAPGDEAAKKFKPSDRRAKALPGFQAPFAMADPENLWPITETRGIEQWKYRTPTKTC